MQDEVKTVTTLDQLIQNLDNKCLYIEIEEKNEGFYELKSDKTKYLKIFEGEFKIKLTNKNLPNLKELTIIQNDKVDVSEFDFTKLTYLSLVDIELIKDMTELGNLKNVMIDCSASGEDTDLKTDEKTIIEFNYYEKEYEKLTHLFDEVYINFYQFEYFEELPKKLIVRADNITDSTESLIRSFYNMLHSLQDNKDIILSYDPEEEKITLTRILAKE